MNCPCNRIEDEVKVMKYPKILTAANVDRPEYVWIHMSLSEGVAISLDDGSISESCLYTREVETPIKYNIDQWEEFPFHLLHRNKSIQT